MTAPRRLNRPLIIGLTGSIGMGKSTVARLLKQRGFPIYDADSAVHDLLKKGGAAVKPVAKLFPEAVKRDAIDRKAVGRAVFAQPDKLKQLEAILHPLVRRAEKTAIAAAKAAKKRAVILEIPLLFETEAELRCDVVFCVSAPRAVQKARVMARPGMTEARFRAIRARQMPDAEKRGRADFIIPTGGDLASTARALDKVLTQLGLLP
jgi:dephospho-CoA kinase